MPTQKLEVSMPINVLDCVAESTCKHADRCAMVSLENYGKSNGLEPDVRIEWYCGCCSAMCYSWEKVHGDTSRAKHRGSVSHNWLFDKQEEHNA